MSWHLPRRLTTLHHAVSIALLYSVSSAALPSIAQAANIGKTMIASAQHEPLAASIIVTDVKAANFSASLANPLIYQQMGLTPNDSMSVRFIPISATTGQVIINTTQPVSMPFADVVLTLNDNGQRNVVPKTLLMPLGNSGLAQSPNSVNAPAQKPNLSIIKAADTQPLTVRRGTPPPLRAKPNVQIPIQVQTLPQNMAPKTESNSTLLRVNLSPIASSSLGVPAAPKIQTSPAAASTPVMLANTPQSGHGSSAINNTNTSNTNTVNTQAITAQNKKAEANSPSIRTTDKLLDILTIQVTQHIQVSNKKVATANSPSQPSMWANVAKESSAQSHSQSYSIRAAELNDSKAATEENLPHQQAALTSPDPTPKAAGYTVQRNDNLWIISQHIAQQNNLNIQTIMTQIQNQNPNAFIKQDASRLKYDAQLNFPSYDIVPSQQSLQTAITAQRQQQYLQATRQRTADQAKYLKATNSSLDNNPPKLQLQLQNQKLTEIAARLKKLRNQ